MKVVVHQRTVEVAREVATVRGDGHIEVGTCLLVPILCHIERTTTVVGVGVFSIGANGHIEVLVGLGCILEVEVARSAVYVCCHVALLVAYELVEVGNGGLELLVQQTCNTSAIVGVG